MYVLPQAINNNNNNCSSHFPSSTHMVRLVLEDAIDNLEEGSNILLAIGLFLSVSVLVALCAKHARPVPQKQDGGTETSNYSKCVAPKSPLASPKKLVTSTISNKAVPIFMDNQKDGGDDAKRIESGDKEEGGGGFGGGGLWQKSILMGERCRPPEFSGVIYYDSHGNQLSQMPRSPRASPLPKFSFPVVKGAS